MTVSSTTNRISYTGNGVTTAFAFSYPFQSQADLKVLKVTIADGTEVVQTITTDYTISGTTTNGVYVNGGTVNMVSAPSSSYKIVIYRDPVLTQTIDLVENDALPAETLEQGLDKSIFIAQRTRELTDRSVTLSEGFTGTFDTKLPSNINTANVLLKVNADGDGWEIGPTTGDIADAEENAAAAAASAAAALASESAAAVSESNAASTLAAAQVRATLTTKGDLYAATGNATTTRLPAGTNGYFLQSNSGATEGLQYVIPQNSSYALVNLGMAASVGSSAMTISLKTAAGSDPSSTDPVFIGFRHSTLSTGQFVMRAVTSALSTVISSGSTAGQTSGVASTMYWYAIDNAGTVELAWSRTYYNDAFLWSTTAEGGAGGADSAATLYSTTARTNVPIRLLAVTQNTQATAGAWATAPSRISLRPSAVGATFLYTQTNSGQSISNSGSGAAVVYEDVVIDTHNAYNTSNGNYTLPSTGQYLVFGGFTLTGSTGWSAEPIGAFIQLAGTTVYTNYTSSATSGSSIQVGTFISGLVNGSAGEAVRIVAFQASGGALNLDTASTFNTLGIIKVEFA